MSLQAIGATSRARLTVVTCPSRGCSAHRSRNGFTFLAAASRPGVVTRAQLETKTQSPTTQEAPVIPTVKPKAYLYFLAANLSVYAAGVVIALTVSGDASNDFFLQLAKVDQSVAMGEWWRLLTANFMHAGLLHLVLNCVALYMLAPQAEAALGYYTFTSVYLLSGVAGSVASYVTDDLVTVGASGAIFGILGALTAFWVRNPTLERRQTQLFTIGAILSINIILGLNADGLIDNTGHVAGYAAGFGLGWAMTPVFLLVPAAAAAASSDASATFQIGEGAGNDAAPGAEEEAGGPQVLGSIGASNGTGGVGKSATEMSGTEGDDADAGGAALSGSAALIDLLSQMTGGDEAEGSIRLVEVPGAGALPAAAPVTPKQLMTIVDQTSARRRYISTAVFLVVLAVATAAETGVRAEDVVSQLPGL